VNAASDRDMAIFAAGMIQVNVMPLVSVLNWKDFFNHPAFLLQAELKGKQFLCRTAASFVSARVGIIPKAPIVPKDLGINKQRIGGLIVVGSYVPKTTKQVKLAMSYNLFISPSILLMVFSLINPITSLIGCRTYISM